MKQTLNIYTKPLINYLKNYQLFSNTKKRNVNVIISLLHLVDKYTSCKKKNNNKKKKKYIYVCKGKMPKGSCIHITKTHLFDP